MTRRQTAYTSCDISREAWCEILGILYSGYGISQATPHCWKRNDGKVFVTATNGLYEIAHFEIDGEKIRLQYRRPYGLPRETLTLDNAEELTGRCGSYDRIHTILQCARVMPEDKWLKLLGNWWSLCDDNYLYANKLLRSPFGKRNGTIPEMMDEAELAAFAQLPETVTAYRGCYHHNMGGWSWTLSKKTAERFPLTFRYRHPGKEALLLELSIPKKRIAALKLDRKEEELIVVGANGYRVTSLGLMSPFAESG